MSKIRGLELTFTIDEFSPSTMSSRTNDRGPVDPKVMETFVVTPAGKWRRPGLRGWVEAMYGVFNREFSAIGGRLTQTWIMGTDFEPDKRRRGC